MKMNRRSQKPLCLWVLVAMFVLHQNILFPVVMCSRTTFGDQKTYYSPPSDPHTGGSHHGGHHTPSHGGSGTPGTGGSCPPTTPSTPTPSTPTPSTPGYNYSPPSRGGSPPSTGNTPPVVIDPPSVPTPSTPGYNYSPPSRGGSPPSTGNTPPVVIDPPSVPTDPSISRPPTPFIPLPHSPSPFTGTCDYWRTHPQVIWGLFGWWGTTVGGVFGVLGHPSSGSDMSLVKALSNTRTDGIGALYREGTASLLNSMVNNRFPFSTDQVKDGFTKALASSERAAATQAELFKKANEGRLKPRA